LKGTGSEKEDDKSGGGTSSCGRDVIVICQALTTSFDDPRAKEIILGALEKFDFRKLHICDSGSLSSHRLFYVDYYVACVPCA